MTSPARKFTDADVRSDPDLMRAAVEHARDYRGEFDFLVAAQELVLYTETLPVAVARGVLNCMRADPSASWKLPAPARIRAVPDERPEPARPKPDPEPRRLPVVREYPATVGPYFVAKNGYVVHRTAHASCRWVRDFWESGPLRPAELLVAPRCLNEARVRGTVTWGSWATMKNPRTYRTFDDALADAVRKCRTGCFPREET